MRVTHTRCVKSDVPPYTQAARSVFLEFFLGEKNIGVVLKRHTQQQHGLESRHCCYRVPTFEWVVRETLKMLLMIERAIEMDDMLCVCVVKS